VVFNPSSQGNLSAGGFPSLITEFGLLVPIMVFKIYNFL